MSDASPETEPTRRQWVGFWSMIVQQSQNAFNDKVAQFTLIPLAGAVGFTMQAGDVEMDVPSVAGLMIALPFVLFAPLAGWLSDRYSKRDVMLGSAVLQMLVLGYIAGALWLKSMPLALIGFFALAVQSAFYSPAKIGINKELVGSKHLGFAAGFQQMAAIIAILAGQIAAGWLFDERLAKSGGEPAAAWAAAFGPLAVLALCSVPALGLALIIPRVPAQGGPPFSAKLAVSHFINLADLWRDTPLRRASFGEAFFWGFAAFINLWSVKLAQWMTGGGEGFGTLSSVFMAAASIGMAAGFGCASYLLRRRIELGWVPIAGCGMAGTSLAMAVMPPDGWPFLAALGFLAFSGAIFLAPLIAWMQDRYPHDKRGELQAAVNLQGCFAGIIAIVIIVLFEQAFVAWGIGPGIGFRIEIAFVGLACALITLFIIRLLPGEVIRLVGGAVVRRYYRIRTVNLDRLPMKGGALLLPNHVTFADGFFISAACPRPVRFVMDEAFTARRSIRLFTAIFETVTIRRDQPREAIRVTIDALKNGDVVCLFPEGQLTRTGALAELRRGFELIARKAGHPLVPLWCDGSWGSIFSFERGRFFRKLPYREPRGMTLAFGEHIPPDEATLESVRQGLLVTAAEAISRRFAGPAWAKRVPPGKSAAAKNFRTADPETRRRMWTNGYQIGQIHALQRRAPFCVLAEDPALAEVAPLLAGFTALFEAEQRNCELLDGEHSGVWVGGDLLRDRIGTTQLAGDLVFYDFGSHALDPLYRAGVLHCPCLALEGIVIAMSMPDPAKPTPDSDHQAGRKTGTWGKLLPGFYLLTDDTGTLRVHGPAAPPEGIALPGKCQLDPEGFLMAEPKPANFRVRRG